MNAPAKWTQYIPGMYTLQSSTKINEYQISTYKTVKNMATKHFGER